jgi:serine/threonine-protein kinase
MTPERWQQIDQLFHSALKRDAEQRDVFLREACKGDESLRREVVSLLGSHEEANSFIRTAAEDIAADLMVGRETQLKRGQYVGHYQVVSLLGEGGMGEVYLAHDVRLGRHVALKRLPAKFTLDADRVHRFKQEARAVSALNHPNIVTIHEIGRSNSSHFITTEFIEGETLRQHIAKAPMTLDEALDVATQIASALTAAHSAGIIHRDIKPENIMLRRDGFIKVLDFGLAKLASNIESISGEQPLPKALHKTDPGMVMGTVQYMSPEQARGEDTDPRTDIWSLGVLLYELLSGHAPFTGETASHTVVSILEAEPLPLRNHVKAPAELERIVMKTLSKKRHERYQEASDLERDLKTLRLKLDETATLRRVTQANETETKTSTSAMTTGDVVQSLPTASIEYLVGEITRHKIVTIAALLVLLVGSVGLAYFLTSRHTGTKKSIAVLPLKPIDATNRNEIYEIGIADSLIYRISLMKQLLVRSLSATRKYADLTQDPVAAGREQQVDYVLASNYQLASGKIRITWQLLNVANGQVEEIHKTENDIGDLFAMQDAVASEVENILLARFVSTSSGLVAKRRTTNEEAYRLYLQGMYLANKRNPTDAQKAVETLEQAVRLDPTYAVAWAGLAYALRPVGPIKSNREAHQRAIEAINKALALDENLADAYSTLCENQMYYEYDFIRAEQSCKRAIELDPDSSQAHDIYSRYLLSRGRFDQAITEIKTAIGLEPTSLYSQRNLGLELFIARRYSESVGQLKRVVAMDKNFDTAHFWLSTALAMQGNESEAFEWLMKLLALRAVDDETIQAYRAAFQMSGWQGVLRERAERFKKSGEDDIDGAAYYAQTGNKDKAFECLERVYQSRNLWMAYLKVDPRLDALRDDVRFDELVRRVESR